MRTHRPNGEHGFSLIEVLVSTVVLMAVIGTAFSLVTPSNKTYKAQPEVADMQQRMRIGQTAIQQDLLLAGAGTYSGIAVGTLLGYFSPIVPYKMGTDINDPRNGIVYRPDAITIFYVPHTAAQTTIRERMPRPSAEVKVKWEPGCPESDQLCGFEEGMRVVIFDETGAYDPFTVTQVQEDALHLQHRDDDFSKAYEMGAVISQVMQHTYYLESNVGTNTFRLMHYDGYRRNEPLVDDVVGLNFRYYGTAQHPQVLSLTTRPFTTYGPKPPAIGVDNAGDPYGPGENCLFEVDGATGRHTSRLDLAPGGGMGLVEITQAELTDGPWCPTNTADNRFDADMLRLRRVAVSIRVQVASADLRGPAGVLFTRAGTSKDSLRLVPDQEISFEVAPRNLNLGR